MGENFIKFKKRALIIRLLKSILAGISLGLFVFSVLFLLPKLKLLTSRPNLFIIISVTSGLVFAVAMFFLLRLSDKRLARKLDGTFKLDERVQTMLQYRDIDSAMHTLQRSDTNDALSAISKKHLGIKTLWVYILCFVLSAAALTGAILYTPPVEPPPEIPEIPEEAFSISELQIAAMEELIQYVTDSEMESPYKESVVLSLETLLEDLKAITTEREKNEAVTASMNYILEQTDMSSYALELIVELWNIDADGSKRLAEAINYYSWPKADEWDKFSSQLSNFRASFIHADSLGESPEETKMVTETQMVLVRISSAISTALMKSEMPSEDALYKVLERLAQADETKDDGTRVYGLSKLSDIIVTNGYSNTQRELDATMTALGNEIFRTLEQHKANTETGEYAITRLSEIFDCECPAFERPVLREITSNDPTAPGDDESPGTPGGPGIGTVYGSDDLVLDPYTNTYVEYGTILDKYYALMFGKLQDGNYTDEEKEAMEKYFSILYGGFEGKEEE